jgi:hypothetical protein
MFLNSWFAIFLVASFSTLQFKHHLARADFIHNEHKQNDGELVENLRIGYQKDETKSLPDRFSVKFKAFEKNFSAEFRRIDKRSLLYPIQSSKIFIIDSNNELDEFKISQDQVVNLKLVRFIKTGHSLFF